MKLGLVLLLMSINILINVMIYLYENWFSMFQMESGDESETYARTVSLSQPLFNFDVCRR